jgi:hypothetical protein
LTSLLILVGTAAAGLLRLWLKHRRVVRNNYTDIDSYGATLRKLSTGTGADISPDGRRPRSGRRRPASHASSLYPPVRPEAAPRRVVARRSGGAG